jgi:hypothetical protein
MAGERDDGRNVSGETRREREKKIRLKAVTNDGYLTLSQPAKKESWLHGSTDCFRN